jgi:hypothetical protein
MNTQTVTLELPESLYRTAIQIAQATERPIAEVLQDSLAHALPPLDDLPPEEAVEVAQFSILGDAALWQIGEATLPAEHQAELNRLLDCQNTKELSPVE